MIPVRSMAPMLAFVLAACAGDPATGHGAAADVLPTAQAGTSPGTDPVLPDCACYVKHNCPDVQIGGVRFLSASPPGTWAHQANTGLAAAMMVIDHLQDITPTAADIVEAQELLKKQSAGGWQPRGGQGDPAGVTSLQIVNLAVAHGLAASPRQMALCEMLAGDLEANRPLVVLAAAQPNNHYPSKTFHAGPAQFMVLVGIDSQYAYLLDPAQPVRLDACGPDCRGRAYDLWQFATAWAQNGNLTVRIAYPMK